MKAREIENERRAGALLALLIGPRARESEILSRLALQTYIRDRLTTSPRARHTFADAAPAPEEIQSRAQPSLSARARESIVELQRIRLQPAAAP